MGLAFLTPLFLAGLLALALPVLLHLTRRRQTEAVAFPSLMFLARVPYRSMRRRRLRHLGLLLLRCAAYSLLVLAFARPLLHGVRADASTLASQRHRVVVIDRSFSMDYGDRFERARAAAKGAISELSADDLVSVVAFSDEGEAVIGASADKAAAGAAIDRLAPTDRATRLAPALKLARQLLLESAPPKREVVLISDFQRSARPDDDDLVLPSGTELRTVDLSQEGGGDNLAITAVTLDRGRGAQREQVVVSARLLNLGASRASGIAVELEVNDRVVAQQTAAIEPASSTTLAFEPVRLDPALPARGLVRAKVNEASQDLLERDNQFRFVLSPSQGIGVLIASSGRRAEGLYLERALALGHYPYFRVATRRAPSLGPGDLEGVAVAILNDSLHELSAVAVEALAQHVEAGGGLLIALGRDYPADHRAPLAERLQLPRVVRAERAPPQGTSIAFVDLDHPALSLFGAPRSGDFSKARAFRHHQLEPPGDATVLARFTDGQVALLELQRGQGRIVIWPSTLDTYWSDLVLQPLFLPFVHRLAVYLAGYEPPREWYPVGQVADLAAELERSTPATGGQEWLVVSPSGRQTTVPAGSSVPIELDEGGFWEVRPVALAQGARRGATLLAANLDAEESDLTPLDVELLAASLTRSGVEDAASRAGTAAPAPRTSDAERRQRGWWYLLAALGALLAGESWLATRLSTDPERGRGGSSPTAGPRQEALERDAA